MWWQMKSVSRVGAVVAATIADDMHESFTSTTGPGRVEPPGFEKTAALRGAPRAFRPRGTFAAEVLC